MKAESDQGRIAEAKLDRDIANGLLPERYRTEILQPQIEALEAKKTSLPEKGVAAGEFVKAQAPAMLPLDASSKPAAPGRGGPTA